MADDAETARATEQAAREAREARAAWKATAAAAEVTEFAREHAICRELEKVVLLAIGEFGMKDIRVCLLGDAEDEGGPATIVVGVTFVGDAKAFREARLRYYRVLRTRGYSALCNRLAVVGD